MASHATALNLDAYAQRQVGIKTSIRLTETERILNFQINKDAFIRCTATEYVNFVIWDKEGNQIYREIIEVTSDISRTFFVEEAAVLDYSYHLYIDGSKPEHLSVGDVECLELRKDMNHIDLVAAPKH